MSTAFHPLASLFPLLEGEEFEQFVEDIKLNGLRDKIDLYEGKIVDGRNRYRALQQLGRDPEAEPEKYFRKAIYIHTIGGEIAPHEQDNDARVRAYIISKNIHRRHLSGEQRLLLLIELIARTPEKSDRQIGKEIGVDHKTVGRARARGEDVGRIPHVEQRTDTKGRQQPASKPERLGREDSPHAEAPKIDPSIKMKRLHALQVIDLLLHPEMRAQVIKAVVEGERHHRFGDFSEAVAALYAELARAGR
jgi:ParB-like chromosome segregation protein Spo0J